MIKPQVSMHCEKILQGIFIPVTLIKNKQLLQQYLAGVFATLWVSCTDHVTENVHILHRVCIIHRLTGALGDDQYLYFLKSPNSWQRDWKGNRLIIYGFPTEVKLQVFLHSNTFQTGLFYRR